MSGSPGSTVGKITLGGIALLLLGVLADVSGLFNFVTGNTLHDLLSNSQSNVSRSPSPTAGSKTAPKNGSVRTNPPIQTPQGPPPAYLNDLEPVGGSNSFDEKGAFSIDGHPYPYTMSFATSTQGESE